MTASGLFKVSVPASTRNEATRTDTESEAFVAYRACVVSSSATDHRERQRADRINKTRFLAAD